MPSAEPTQLLTLGPGVTRPFQVSCRLCSLNPDPVLKEVELEEWLVSFFPGTFSGTYPLAYTQDSLRYLRVHLSGEEAQQGVCRTLRAPMGDSTAVNCGGYGRIHSLLCHGVLGSRSFRTSVTHSSAGRGLEFLVRFYLESLPLGSEWGLVGFRLLAAFEEAGESSEPSLRKAHGHFLHEIDTVMVIHFTLMNGPTDNA